MTTRGRPCPARRAARPAGAAVGRSMPCDAQPATRRPRDRDDAVARQPEQRDDREHERRRRAVARDRLVRREDRLREPDREPAGQRRPERSQPADQRRGERGDDEERQRGVVERGEQVGEQQAGRAADEPGAEPRRRLDAAHGHAERRGDLTVVRKRPHRRAELRDAQEERWSPAVMTNASASAMICVRLTIVAEDLVRVARARQRQEAARTPRRSARARPSGRAGSARARACPSS